MDDTFSQANVTQARARLADICFQICHLGNFSALEYFENTNADYIDLEHEKADPTPDETRRIRAKIQQTRYKFHKVFQMDKDIVNQLLIPIVDTSHFLSSWSTSMLPAPNSI